MSETNLKSNSKSVSSLQKEHRERNSALIYSESPTVSNEIQSSSDNMMSPNGHNDTKIGIVQQYFREKIEELSDECDKIDFQYKFISFLFIH